MNICNGEENMFDRVPKLKVRNGGLTNLCGAERSTGQPA